MENPKELDVFHFEDGRKTFEDCGETDGAPFWYARDFMELLGYSNFSSFRPIINRAIGACTTLNIDVFTNFRQVDRVLDSGTTVQDFKLSKFACYLVAMNGDTKKEQVAKAQLYFVTVAETLRTYIEESENIERLHIRGEVSEREKSLAGVAKGHGVDQYQLFQNAGYRGMYNKNMNDLKAYKGLVELNRSLLDYMGKEELAANLYRLTQTESKIKNSDLRGQSRLEGVAEEVGRLVRKSMLEISGTRPEDLPLGEDLKKVKQGLKSTAKRLQPGKKALSRRSSGSSEKTEDS